MNYNNFFQINEKPILSNFYHPSNQLPNAPLPIPEPSLPPFQTLLRNSLEQPAQPQNLKRFSKKEIDPLPISPLKINPQVLIEDGVYTEFIKDFHFPNIVLYEMENNSSLKIFNFEIKLKKNHFPNEILLNRKNISINTPNFFTPFKNFIVSNENNNYILISIPFQIFEVTIKSFRQNSRHIETYEKTFLEVKFNKERRLIHVPVIFCTRSAICDRIINDKENFLERIKLQNFFKNIGECRYNIIKQPAQDSTNLIFQINRPLLEKEWELRRNNESLKRKIGSIELAGSEQPAKRKRL